MNWFKSLPTIAKWAIVIAAIMFGFGVFGSVMGWQYSKARKEYQKQEDAWKVERTTLIANAEAKEKKIQELEPQVMAFKAAADAGKKVDEALADKIDSVVAEANREAEITNMGISCVDRARRMCEKFRANKIPIDCAALERKCNTR